MGFMSPKKPVESPTVKMPDPDDISVREAALRRRREAATTGRDSTRMSADMTSQYGASPTDPGAAYTKTVLG